MRYSTGHQGVTCQGCHESIHGLYPVTPTIDTTSYAQAAALNHDGTHGPVKCGGCHTVGSSGRPNWIQNSSFFGGTTFDGAVGWSHTFTQDASMRNTVCRNCHGDEWNEVDDNESEYLKHADVGRVSRAVMDKVEIEKTGAVFGTTNPRTTVCTGCHGDNWNQVSCSNTKWKQHLGQGRVAASVWEAVSLTRTGTTCGW
jgi:hypothetical protein